MSKFEWQNFSKLHTYYELSEYLQQRPFTHSEYCHYTKLGAIDGILKSNSFWLTCSTGFNDIQDKRQFDEPKCNYSLCFSTGINENLALWYLYSGMDGMGGRIRFSPNNIKKLIESSHYYLYKKNGEKLQKKPVMELIEGKTMITKFSDVIYYGNKKHSDFLDLKYNTMTNHEFLFDEFEKFKNENMGFCKGLIWYHEKETRLLVTLIDKAKEYVLNSQGDYVVVLTFDERILKRIKIDLAPEITDIENGINGYTSIENFFINNKKRINLSEYYGQVSMNLCIKCKKYAKRSLNYSR